MRRVKIALGLALVLCSARAWGNPFPAEYTTVGQYGGHWYALTVGWGTWQDCEDEATGLGIGAHLVSINSDPENTWLTSFIKDAYFWLEREDPQDPGGSNAAWIGYFFDQEDQQWEWASGQGITYTNLHPDWDVYSGFYGHMHGENHREPGYWQHNDMHNTDPNLYFRGVIEVPEPAMLGTLALGGLALLRRRKA